MQPTCRYSVDRDAPAQCLTFDHRPRVAAATLYVSKGNYVNRKQSADIKNKSMGWEEFKAWSETLFKDRQLEKCWGYQIQPGTKWNPGLSPSQIHDLEKVFGFEFPDEYKRMLSALNGFDRDKIAIDPDQVEASEFSRQCYQYPENLDNVQWLITEIAEHIDYVKEALSSAGFEAENVIGFVPLYAHRALAVFKDKSLTPVISIHQGTDVIVYGKSLMEYWLRELST